MSELKVPPPANQDLESLCYLETMFQEYGYDDGFRDGEVSGELEGRIVGCEKAFELGREIGFYAGCVEMWTELHTAYPDKVPARAMKQIEALKKQIDEFPTYNDHDVDLFGLRDKMKNKLRVISSLLGINQRFFQLLAAIVQVSTKNNEYEDTLPALLSERRECAQLRKHDQCRTVRA